MELMKIICLQEGDTLVEATYLGHRHNALLETVQVEIELRTKTRISDKKVGEVFTADNSTRLLCYNKVDGTPIMLDNIVVIGYEKTTVDNGDGTSQEVDNLNAPILLNRPYQKTIGEYDRLYMLMFKKGLYGPGLPGAVPVELMVETAILQRYGGAEASKHYE